MQRVWDEAQECLPYHLIPELVVLCLRYTDDRECLNEFLLPELTALCQSYAAEHPFQSILPTVPNVVRCARGVVVEKICTPPRRDHYLASASAMRNLQVRSARAGTTVTLRIGGNDVLSLTLATAHEWTEFGEFTGWNVLFTGLGLYHLFEVLADDDVELTYEQCQFIFDPSSWPFQFPVVFQRVQEGVYLSYAPMPGLCLPFNYRADLAARATFCRGFDFFEQRFRTQEQENRYRHNLTVLEAHRNSDLPCYPSFRHYQVAEMMAFSTLF